MFYGQPYNAYQTNQGTQLHGYVSISSNQPIGQYDLEVFDLNTQNWVMMSGAFMLCKAIIVVYLFHLVVQNRETIFLWMFMALIKVIFRIYVVGVLMEYPDLRLYNIFSGDSINIYNNAWMDWSGIR